MVARLIIVMGPSGCGKSTVGESLASCLGASFLEGDTFHPDANRNKMTSGIPLTDDDRSDWLDAIELGLKDINQDCAVLACSALTPYVQNRLRALLNWDPIFFLLQVSEAVLAERLKARSGHFMPASLLQSQLETLSPPEDAFVIDAEQSPSAIVADIAAKLGDKA